MATRVDPRLVEARRLANMMTAEGIVTDIGLRRLVSDECHDETVTRIQAALNAKDMARDLDEGKLVEIVDARHE